MPDMETTTPKEQEVLQLGGVNEAVDLLQVEKYQFATLQSLMPVEVGELQRMLGKETERKFASSVMSIHQMHTPVGHTMRIIQTGANVEFDLDSPSEFGPLFTPDFVPPPADMQDYILLHDEKAFGTDGGGFTSAAWRTRDINQEKIDAGGHCALIGANQFTLAAGTYRAHIRCPQYSVGLTIARLQNITAAATTLRSGNVYANDAAVDCYAAVIIGQFTIGVTTTFEIQHRSGVTKATNGFGRAVGLDATFVELYTVAEFIKIA